MVASAHIPRLRVPRLINAIACNASRRVRERYEEEYVATKHRAAAQARGGGAFAFDESRIFRKFDLFCKRVRKLQSMFTTGEGGRGSKLRARARKTERCIVSCGDI